MLYDIIIIGAGASGLFAGASMPSSVNGLILEKSTSPGKKLLMTGAGQCNLTHGGNIKDFLTHYGQNGKAIRSILYSFNNKSLIEFFSDHGVPTFQREDGKIFPESLQGSDILNVLVSSCKNNGFKFIYSSPVTKIVYNDKHTNINNLTDQNKNFNFTSNQNYNSNIIENSDLDNLDNVDNEYTYTVISGLKTYYSRNLIIATGGASYPSTGSDGCFLHVLNDLSIEITNTKPALVPIHVQSYPYSDLSGISFSNASVSITQNQSLVKNLVVKEKQIQNTDGLLLTHTCFSGPSILNISRHASTGDFIHINYFPKKPKDMILNELKKLIIGNSKQILTLLYEYFNDDLSLSPSAMPKRFLEAICKRLDLNPSQKSSQLSGSDLKNMVHMITSDTYSISGLGGYNLAMVTNGGVSLDELNMKTLESKKYPNLFIIGEALDVDGDTGGYNLQFAFSSGHLVAQQI